MYYHGDWATCPAKSVVVFMQNQTNPQPTIPDAQLDASLRTLDSPWLRRHALFGPFGIFISAWLMCWSDTGTWRIWTDWSAMSDLADLAVIIYGMIAVIIERGLIIMFWAIERRKQMREEFRARMEAKGRADLLAELKSKANLQDDGAPSADWLDRMARELEDSAKK